jgi:hypothetical protein
MNEDKQEGKNISAPVMLEYRYEGRDVKEQTRFLQVNTEHKVYM